MGCLPKPFNEVKEDHLQQNLKEVIYYQVSGVLGSQTGCVSNFDTGQVGHSKLNDRWSGELRWTVAVAIFNFNFIRGTQILFEWHRQA